jgi:hypothetical protein
MASLSNRFRAVSRRAERIAPDVMLIVVVNHPRDLDADMGEIPIKGEVKGELVRREPNESYPAFHDRLRAMARERGAGVAIVGSDETRPTPPGPLGLVKITDPDPALPEAAGEPVGGL